SRSGRNRFWTLVADFYFGQHHFCFSKPVFCFPEDDFCFCRDNSEKHRDNSQECTVLPLKGLHCWHAVSFGRLLKLHRATESSSKPGFPGPTWNCYVPLKLRP